MDTGASPRLDEHGFPAKEAFPNVHDIYNREAKIYDAAMIERWRTAMDGLLIFAGLFSAALTAFIIESYKLLKQDSGNLTVSFLYQISQQMALLANGTQALPSSLLPPPPEVPFSPPWTSLVANILWFISLGLSLACAVAATLVQQWARNYTHTIERRPSAERRARMRMYLFDGVERFGMSQIVDGVPVLLHLSLFSFLLGLVFFIETISLPLTAITIVILLLSVGAYLCATLLPLLAFDCPIQTPLTSVAWRQSLIRMLYFVIPRICIVRHAIVLAGKYLGARVRHHTQHSFLPSVTTMWKALPRTPQLHKFIPSRIRKAWERLTLRETFDAQWARLTKRLTLKEILDVQWVRLTETWSFDGSDSLDAVRSSAARDTRTHAFKEREKKAFTWLVESLEEDREILPFIEAMPVFVKKADRGHDAQSTFSYIFCHSRLRLYTWLPVLLHRHRHNERVQIAFAEFHHYVQEEDWKHIFNSGLTTPRDMWPDYLPSWDFAAIMASCPPEIRASMNSIQATINFCWLSTGYQPYSIISDRREQYASAWWPDVFKTLWEQMLGRLPHHTIPSSLRPTLSFTKALLNSLADKAPLSQQQLILQSYLPMSTTWLTMSPMQEHQQSYITILKTIISAIETNHEDEVFVSLLESLEPLLSRLQNMSERTVLKDLDHLLQAKIWFQSSILSDIFKTVVEAHIVQVDDSGNPILCLDVIKTYNIAMLTRVSNYAEGVMVLRSLDLQQTNGVVQQAFVRHSAWVYVRQWWSWDPRWSATDRETGIEEVVLFFESAIEVFYTLDDLDALRHALALINNSLAPSRYPYNTCALEGRLYLEQLIRRKVLLESV